MRRGLVIALVAALIAIGVPTDTLAQGIQVCNEKPPNRPGRTMFSEVWFAVGYETGGNWYSAGWWKARPEECKTIYSLPGRKFYLSVMDRNPRDGMSYDWPGAYVFCARDKNYEKMPAANCRTGYRKIDFFEDSEGPSTSHRTASAKFVRLSDGSRVRRVYLYVR